MPTTEGQESVAPVDPSVTVIPQAATPDPETERLQHKLSEANRHAREARKAAEDEAKRAAEALARLQEIEQQQLAGQGEFKQLWEDAKATNQTLQNRITELEQELANERTSVQTQRLKAAAIARISDAGARKPDQLLRLIDEKLVDHNGEPAVLKGGVEVPLPQYLETLKQPGSDWEHHFLPTAKRGMGTPPSAPGLPGAPEQQQNPYLPGGNLTYRVMLEATQPELAAALRAEAGVG